MATSSNEELDLSPAPESTIEGLFDLPGVTHVIDENSNDTPPSSGNSCAYCGKYVDPSDESTYSQITSWVSGKKKDSAILRTYTGRYACKYCIELQRAGLGPDQAEVFGLLDEPVVSRADDDVDLFTDETKDYKAGYAAGLVGENVISFEFVSDDFRRGYVAGKEKREGNSWAEGQL